MTKPYRQKIRSLDHEPDLEKKLKYIADEGCNMHGYLEVNKVSGSFAFVTAHITDSALVASVFGGSVFNASHVIHDVQVLEADQGHIVEWVRGQREVKWKSPLKGYEEMTQHEWGVHAYEMHVIKVHHMDGLLREASAYQYTVSNDFSKWSSDKINQNEGVTAVRFDYKLSNVVVSSRVLQKSLLRFIAHCCALFGGVFTVVGLIDKLIETHLEKGSPQLPALVGLHPTSMYRGIDDLVQSPRAPPPAAGAAFSQRDTKVIPRPPGPPPMPPRRPA